MATKTVKKKTIRTIPQERTPCPEQDPAIRARNFDEVSLGYGLEEALREAERCLQCPDEPCVRGCPVGIDIPAFIKKISEKHLHGAYDIITDTNLLASVCGRVCPQENQCEGVCTVGESLEPVAIGRLERFVGDTAIREGWANIPYIEPSGCKVGIVGAVRHDLAQGALEMIGGQAKGLEQDALGSGQTGQGGFAGNHDRIVGTAAALCWPAAPVRGWDQGLQDCISRLALAIDRSMPSPMPMLTKAVPP